MELVDLKNRRTQIIIGLVALFSIFALWLRLLPMLNMGNTDILMMVASDDPLYNLRQVEQILANFPNYAWFEPMTLFPTGQPVPWGPLFPTIIAIVCLITGATTRPEIISMGLLVPPRYGSHDSIDHVFRRKNLRGLEDRSSGIRFYGRSIRSVFLPLFLWVYGSPYCRSSFFYHFLPAIYVCDLFRKRYQNRAEKYQFL